MSEKHKAYIDCAFPPCRNKIPPGANPPLCNKHREWSEKYVFGVWMANMMQRAAQVEAQGKATGGKLVQPGDLEFSLRFPKPKEG